jgi:hypothetical protein
MSLVTTCFVSGGGLGTALGSTLIKVYGFNVLFLYYGIALFLLTIAVMFFVRNIDKLAH